MLLGSQSAGHAGSWGMSLLLTDQVYETLKPAAEYPKASFRLPVADGPSVLKGTPNRISNGNQLAVIRVASLAQHCPPRKHKTLARLVMAKLTYAVLTCKGDWAD